MTDQGNWEVTTNTGDNGTNPFQSTEYQVAQVPPPGYQQGDPRLGADPNANGTGGVPTWRRTWSDPGLVAPGARTAAGDNNGTSPFLGAPTDRGVVVGGGTNGDNPFQTGTGPFVPQNPGRATPGVAPIFPTEPAATNPQVTNPQGTAPVYRTEGGGPTGPIGPDTVPPWIQTIQPDNQVIGPGAVASRPGQGVRFGNSFVPFGADGELLDIYARARQPVENSLYRMTKLNDLLTTGLYTGWGAGALYQGADEIFMRMPEATRNSNPYLKMFGDHLSPMSRQIAASPEFSTVRTLEQQLAQATEAQRIAGATMATQEGLIQQIFSRTAADPARGAAVADVQRAFFNNPANLTPQNILAHSILEPGEIAAAKAYVEAAGETALRQTELASAEQALAQATTAREALRGNLPTTIFDKGAKEAWFNGRTLEKMTDRALSVAKGPGGGKLFDAAEVAAIKALRDAAAREAVAVTTRDAIATAVQTATTKQAAASTAFETLISGASAEAQSAKLGFVRAPGMTAEVIEKAATFTSTEAATLTTYAEAAASRTAATTTATEATAAMSGARTALTNVEQSVIRPGMMAGLGRWGRAIGEGGVIGLGTVGLNIAADYAISTALGEKPRLTGTSAWGIETALLPMIMLNPKMGIGKKIGYSVAAYAGSHIFGSLVGEPGGRFAELGRPSWTEVGLSTLGAVMPFKDWRYRAAAATIGWAVGKGWAIATNDGREPKQDRDEAVVALNQAITGRDQDSFRNGVQEAREIAKINEGAIELMRWDWFRRQSGASKDHPMIAWRGDALLAAGQGLGRIDQGSRLLNGKNHDQTKRYFPDTYVDLGGEGTQALRSAAGTLMMMEDYAKKNPNEVVAGKPIGPEAAQAAALRQQVEAELNKVYGQQDVNAIIERVQYMWREGGDMGNLSDFGVKMAAKINATPDTDPRYKAKLCRDLAMVAVAIAEVQAQKPGGGATINGGDANISFLKAEEAMRVAQRLDPNNVNNKAIYSVIERVRQKIGPAVQRQNTPGVHNPLGNTVP